MSLSISSAMHERRARDLQAPFLPAGNVSSRTTHGLRLNMRAIIGEVKIDFGFHQRIEREQA